MKELEGLGQDTKPREDIAGAVVEPPGGEVQVQVDASVDPAEFSAEEVRRYPRSNRKVSLTVSPYALDPGATPAAETQSSYISPQGIVFQAKEAYPEGTLLRIQVALPDFWSRKQKLVEYSRVDNPDRFRILAKVVRSEDVGKRGKKKEFLVQTVNMDETDEIVLKTFLQEG